MESEIMRQYVQALTFRRKLDAAAFSAYPTAGKYYPEDPMSKCMVAGRSPCRPGAPCPYGDDEGRSVSCSPDCSEYASYSDDDPTLER